MLKKIFLILSISMLVLFIAGCGEPVSDTDDTSVPADNLTPDEPVVCAQDAKECPDGSYVSRDPTNDCEFDACPELEIDSQIKELQEKAKVLKSYEYLDSSTNHIILQKGDKSVIITSQGNEYGSGSVHFNAIFLDHTAKTAFGACMADTSGRDTFPCGKSRDKYAEMDYDDFEIDDAVDKLLALTNGEVVNTITCERKECLIIEYTENDNKYQMLAKSYDAVPYEISEIDEDGVKSNTVTYSNGATDHLKDSEMVVPDHFKLVE